MYLFLYMTHIYTYYLKKLINRHTSHSRKIYAFLFDIFLVAWGACDGLYYINHIYTFFSIITTKQREWLIRFGYAVMSAELIKLIKKQRSIFFSRKMFTYFLKMYLWYWKKKNNWLTVYFIYITIWWFLWKHQRIFIFFLIFFLTLVEKKISDDFHYLLFFIQIFYKQEFFSLTQD